MKTLVTKSFMAMIYILLYFPILVLVLYSVNNARYSLQWQGLSIQWYIELFNDRELWSAFINSVMLGLGASIFATITGLLACVQLFLQPTKKQQRSLFAILLLLIIIPDLVLGVALLLLFNILGIPLGFFSLLFAHVTFCIPFVILMINSRINSLDANVYYSALDLGASRFRALTKVLLPLLWPAVMSALLLCFTLSFDDVIISYFVAGPDFNILPLTIYSLVRVGVTPELNALCTITFFISMILVIIAHRFSRKTL